MNNLFNKQLFERYLTDIKITEEQRNHLELWNSKLDAGELIAETSNYHYFEKVFLNVLFGYDSFTDILADDKEETGSGKSEFKLKLNNKVFMIIELKGSNINLDKTRNDKNETPVDQVFRYAKKNNAVSWLLLSNYDEFRLYNYHKGDGKYISWKIKELINNTDKLKEFIFIFSKKSFEEGIIDNLIDKTITIQEDFNDEFYKLYSETRLMIIHDLEENSENIDRIKAIHYAQLILDRVIFICFAEDKKLLPEQILEETILTPIKNGNVRKDRIFERLRELFEDIHEGNPVKKIPEYNGGLFEERLYFLKIHDTVENPTEYYKDCFSNWKFESQRNETEKLLGDYKDSLNSIYKNFLTMAIFNFDSDVDVNILGHIFESSIGDIEKLREDNRETRHKFGIHYTPSEITEYICKNTIVPYLSKTGEVNEIPELLSEYSNDIEVLDEKLKTIKILDPACGSGAFLNKAVDILLDIHEAVWHQKYDDQVTLDKFFDYESERREIILNNIYGVDLNEESTEITKLGLFLKICKKDKKLPTLDNNIKCGNSVIDDPKYAGDKAFKWEEEFKEIIENGGFDVIIGNPPYVRQELLTGDKEYYENKYTTYNGKADLYVYFFEKGIDLLKDNGIFSYICSDKWTKAGYGKKLRKFILNNTTILYYKDYTREKLFEGATTYPSIILLQKSISDENHSINVGNTYETYQYLLTDKSFTFVDNKIINLKNQLIKKYTKLGSFESVDIKRGVLTGYNQAFHINKSIKNKLINQDINNQKIIKPLLRGRDIKAWQTNFKEIYLIFLNQGTNIEEYPLIKEYLFQFKDNLTPKKNKSDKLGRASGSYKWYELQSQCKFYKYFENNKIIWKESGVDIAATIDSNGYYIDKTCFILSCDEKYMKYILAILNSKISNFIHHLIATPIQGGYSFSKTYMEQIPIKYPNDNEIILFNKLVEIVLKDNNKFIKEIDGFLNWLQNEYKINKLSQKLEKYYELTFEEFLEEIRKKKVDTKKRAIRENLEEEFNNSLKIIKPLQTEIQEIENEINQKVYELYELTDEKIRIIEENI